MSQMAIIIVLVFNHRPICLHLAFKETLSWSRQYFKVQEPGQMNAAVGEIKKLNEQLSQLRQENIVLKVSLSSPEETIVGALEGLYPHYRILVDTSS